MAPSQNLFHALQADHPGRLLAGPLQADPRQIADHALARLFAGRLAVVGAVGVHVELAYGAPAAFFVRVTLEHVGGVVPGRRVIGGVQANCRRFVVPGYRHRSAQAYLQPGTCAAATEEVHHDLIVYRVAAKARNGF